MTRLGVVVKYSDFLNATSPIKQSIIPGIIRVTT